MKPEFIITADGFLAPVGGRVFDYYNGHWGLIENDIDHEGWFSHIREDGSRGYLNGERVCREIPRDNPFYRSHGKGNPQ